MPRAGPEGGECTTKEHGTRSFPMLVRIFNEEGGARIIGLGIMFTESDLFKLGAPSSEAIDIDMENNKHIVGFYGQSTE